MTRKVRTCGSGRGQGLSDVCGARVFSESRIAAEVTGVESRRELVEATNDGARVGMRWVALCSRGDCGIRAAGRSMCSSRCMPATRRRTMRSRTECAAGAPLLVAAPCCHQEIRAQLSRSASTAPVLRHGILAEREAELVTDACARCCSRFTDSRREFSSSSRHEHTGKNLMLAADRLPSPPIPRRCALSFAHCSTFTGFGSNGWPSFSGSFETLAPQRTQSPRRPARGFPRWNGG